LNNQKVTNSCYRFFQFQLKQNKVTYTKAVGTVNEKTRTLWRAKNSIEYCDNKGYAFVEEKLQQEFGWVCIDTITK